MYSFIKKFRPGIENICPGKPEEVAVLVTFLASAFSSFISGVICGWTVAQLQQYKEYEVISL